MVTQGIPFSVAEKNGSGELTTLYLDFYEPSGDTAAWRPLVITVFGGAYVAGNRGFCDMKEYCSRLAKHGYTAASIDYRLMSVFSASAHNIIREMFLAAQDVSSAIRYFKLYGNDYGIDTNNIFLLGNSAGTIALLHEIFMEESERPEETFLVPVLNTLHSCGYAEYAEKSSKVAGAIAQWGGVLNLGIIDSTECIPLCLIHGTDDETVPYDSGYCYSSSFSFLLPYVYGSLPISERLNAIGFEDYEFHPFQGEEHAFYLSTFYQLIEDKFDTCFNITRDFLLRHLDFSWQNETSPNYNDSIQDDHEDLAVSNFYTFNNYIVFPNPTKNIVNVSCNSNDIQLFDIQLFNIYGNLLMMAKDCFNGTQLDISEYADGIYFLKIFGKRGEISLQKIVKAN